MACQASSRAKQPCLAAREAQATCSHNPQPWVCHAGCRTSSCQVLILVESFWQVGYAKAFAKVFGISICHPQEISHVFNIFTDKILEAR